jgi:hypothetical protein
MRKKLLLLLIPLVAIAAASSQAQPSIEGTLENSPVSCFYMLMNTYRQQLNICQLPLDNAREERFSRMSAAMEDYILKNARLDPMAIIANAKGAAERAIQSVPACGSAEFEEIRQAMLNFTTADTEAVLYAQLETNSALANGSCS